MADHVLRGGRRLLAWTRTADPFLLDALIVALVLVLMYAPFLAPWDSNTRDWGVSAYILAACAAVPLLWRRRFPFPCFLVICAAGIGYGLANSGPSQPVGWSAMVAVYTIAERGSRWQRRAMWVVVAGYVIGTFKWSALPSLGLIGRGTADSMLPTLGLMNPRTVMIGLITTASAFALGTLARARRDYTLVLEQRTRLLERERAAETARAAAAERARIARDMHDVLAHAVSLMVVQAEAGPVAVRKDPALAEQSFDAIAEAGRDAMLQLRRMLGVLKEDQDIGVRAPQPTIAAIPALIEQVRRTDLRVELRTSGEPRPLPADAEVAAYRIVQEALTNTVKHAAATAATVSLTWEADELLIVISDNGTATAPSRPGAPGPATSRDRLSSEYGLSGGRDAISGLGASAGGTSGPMADGGRTSGPMASGGRTSGPMASGGGTGGLMADGGRTGGLMADGGRTGGLMASGGGTGGLMTSGGRTGGLMTSGGGTGGQGLIGIRERAVACGGSAEAGPAPGGGFRVAARLPCAMVAA